MASVRAFDDGEVAVTPVARMMSMKEARLWAMHYKSRLL
jgi:hypothetical protein